MHKLVREYLGSLGKVGGKSRSKAKVEAVRENIKKAQRARSKKCAEIKKLLEEQNAKGKSSD